MEKKNNIKEMKMGFLEKPLPKKLPKMKDRLCSEGLYGEINVLPIKTSIRKKQPFDALIPLVSKDDLRPVMGGIYADAENHCLVATNAWVMGIMPNNVIRVTRIVNVKTQDDIPGTFPNYKAVIPEYDNTTKIDIVEWINICAGIARANKFLGGYDIAISVIITNKSTNIRLDPQKLKMGLLALAESGTKNLNIELPEVNSKIVVLRDADDSKRLVLIMPVDFKYGPSCGYAYKTIILNF